MPSSARKSSIGASRRGPQKAHIPYRGDNPEVGKKTGIAVQHVERMSDGFEPFDELIQQADKRTPPKRKEGRRKQSEVIYEDPNDEYGEMSMELDDTPVRYLANTRHIMTPSSNHNGLSSRSVARTPDIDFDKIPSPRRHSRKSLGHASRAGPSRLSTSYRAEDLEDMEDDYEDNAIHQDAGHDGHGHYAGDAGHSPLGVTSFTEMDRDDDEGQEHDYEQQDSPPTKGARRKGLDANRDEDEEEEPAHEEDSQEESEESPTLSRKYGRKSRVALSDVPEEREPEAEDEIERGLDDVDRQRFSDDSDANEEPPEAPPRKAKKAKATHEPRGTQTRPRKMSQKENRVYREGVRKSAREHYKPLEWWRGEKLVYGRSHHTGGGPILVPPIREIIRIPKEEPEPLGKTHGKRKRSTTRARSTSKAAEDMQIKVVPVTDPEEGWDDETPSMCMVMEYPSGARKEMHVTHTARMVKLRTVNDWMFQKVFGEEDYIAAGILVIPPGAKKPTKQTKDNTYVFYVIQGAINLKLHETSLVLATGAMFLIPRGNSYFIENISERDVKLFFTQARKIVDNVSGASPSGRASISVGRAAQARSSSAGVLQGEGRAVSKSAVPLRAASTR